MSNSFPQTRHEMLRAKYKLLSSAKCKGCDALIEWWQTTNGRKIPMNPIKDDYCQAVCHWDTCPNAGRFHTAADVPKRGAVQNPEAELKRLRERTNARVIVLVDETGASATWRGGIPAEELRHDLISAANFVRNEILKKEQTARG